MCCWGMGVYDMQILRMVPMIVFIHRQDDYEGNAEKFWGDNKRY
ncbi:MAG: hypothetical protein CM15mP31_4810 [Gammaproteobacteria bacterium]|nr:MAG: hypothetical protein CM15mP31_4810 [Gammaproteobacteria bacterium]